MANDEIAARHGGANSPEERLPFLDTLSADCDQNLHAARRAASERSWVARTPVGLAFLGYEDVLWLLRDERRAFPVWLRYYNEHRPYRASGMRSPEARRRTAG